MHVLERYALSTGAKIKSPYIYESYYPLPPELSKYITIHPFSHPSKSYDHWNEVVEILLPYLKKENINILQIGKPDETRLSHCFSTENTTINQVAYIINHSMLHVGINAFPIHLANNYNKKIVGLYSHVLAAHQGPYWKDDEKHILLEPERKNGEKPCYSHEEVPKSINSISPEKIAKAVCDLLGIEFDYKYETLSIGDGYRNDLIDIIPNTSPSQYAIVGRPHFNHARIRMDLEFNELGLVENLTQAEGKVTIVTNNPINPHIIRKYHEKINAINFIFDEETKDEEPFIEIANGLGVKNVAFVTYLPEEKYNEIKLKYMDFVMLNTFKHFEIKDAKLKNTEDIYIKSSKRILSNGKIYPNHYSYKNNQPINSLDKILIPIKEDKMFWRDLDYYILLKKKD